MATQQPGGGLNQMAQQPAKAPDTSTIAAAQIVPETQGFDVNREMANLAQGRAELDAQIRKMQEALARRQQLSVDPRMAAFTYAMSQPTKTGSAFEAIGSGLGAYSKAELEDVNRQSEFDKMNLELLAKRQQLQQQMAGQSLLNTMYGGGPETITPMSTQAASMTPVAGAAPGVATAPPGYSQFRPITERDLMLARQIDPESEKFLMELRRTQIEAQKAAAAGYTKIKIPQTDEEVNVPIEIASRYFETAKQAALKNDPQLLIRFMAENGMIAATRKPGSTEYEMPKSASERAAEREGMTETQKERAKASELRGNQLLQRGENAPMMEGLAQDVLSLADTNSRAFDLMLDPTVKDSVLRAIEQGASITAGPMTVAINLPVRTAQGYKLTKEDIKALQLFQQKQSAITAEMRKISRTPGEGATDRAEGQLYAAIGVLPTDSAQVLAMKSEAIIRKAQYDAAAAQLWAKFQNENPNKSFTYFQHFSDDYKQLQKDYVKTLNEIRERNADLLRSTPKAAKQEKAPAAETPIEQFRREKAAREKQGGQ